MVKNGRVSSRCLARVVLHRPDPSRQRGSSTGYPTHGGRDEPDRARFCLARCRRPAL